MALPDLTNQNIQDTYQRVIQKGDDGQLYDGTGSAIPLKFDGDNVIISGSLTAMTYVVSESVVAVSSGSTIFGNSVDDIHQMTGSLKVLGSITASADLEVTNIRADAIKKSTFDIESENGTLGWRFTTDSDPEFDTLSGGMNIGSTADFIHLDNNVTASGNLLLIPQQVGEPSIINVQKSLEINFETVNDGTAQNFVIKNSPQGEMFKISDTGIISLGSADATMTSLGNMTFMIDSDNNETSQYFKFKNYTSELMELNEGGDMDLSGNFTSSGIAKASGLYSTGEITGSGWLTAGSASFTGHVTASGAIKAGSFLTSGTLTADNINITDTDDGLYFGGTQVMFIDASNNVNFGVPSVSVVDLELYGHAHTYTAGSSITLDAGHSINLDAAAGNILFKDSGTEQLRLDMDGTAGEQILQLKVDSDDLVFKQYDGTEVLRIGDDATISANKRKFSVTSDTAGLHDGDVVYFGGEAETIAAGQIVHYNSSGNWELADADDNTKSDGLIGVALGADASVNGVLLRGTVTLDHDAGAIGDPLYLTTTAGDASATAPSGNNNIVRIIGYKIHHATEKQIWFNPDSTFVEVTA